MVKNYVGVTAGKSVDEVLSVLDLFYAAGFSMESKHIPSIGVGVSLNTLNSRPVLHWRFAEFSEVPRIVDAITDRCLAVIHYNTRDQTDLAGQVRRVMSAVSCSTVQLNVEWPVVEEVCRIREQTGADILLQIAKSVKEQESVDAVAERISRYGSAIDGILIDPSRGRGVEFDYDYSVSLYRAVRSACPNYLVCFAGGFDGDNVKGIVRRISDELGHPDFSIDAEGRLRDVQGPGWGQDVLDLDKTVAYIRGAAEALLER